MALNDADRNTILAFCKEYNIKPHDGFKNFVASVNLPHALVLDIDDVPSLQAIMSEIHRLNQLKPNADRIVARAASGGAHKTQQSYSLSQVVAGDIIIRLTGKAFQNIEKTQDENIMRVGASVQIGDLDQALYEKYDLALPTSSLIPYVTVAGLTATAGHGTGRAQPAFSGLIHAMTLCLPNGKIVRLEENDPYFDIIRGAHLGVFGIIIDMELKCMPAKKIQCVMEARSIPEFIEEIKSGLFLHDDYVSALYVPTYQSDELTNKNLKNVLVYRFRPVEKTVNDVNFHPQRSRILQEIEIKMHEDFHIADLLRAFPSLTPYYMQYLASKMSVGKQDSLYVAPWPAFHYQTSFPKDIRDTDYLFETDEEGKTVVMALENFVKRIAAQAEKHEYPVDYGAYIRLFKGTNGGLSTSAHQQDKWVCGFDIVSTPNMKGGDKLSAWLDNYFVHQLKAKLHWGKTQWGKINYADMYGANYQTFINTVKAWYESQGLDVKQSMLVNGFVGQILGLTTAVNDHRYAHASLIREEPQAVAKNLLTVIDGNDIYANQFRDKLTTIAKASTNQNRFGLFKPRFASCDPAALQPKEMKNRLG